MKKISKTNAIILDDSDDLDNSNNQIMQHNIKNMTPINVNILTNNEQNILLSSVVNIRNKTLINIDNFVNQINNIDSELINIKNNNKFTNEKKHIKKCDLMRKKHILYMTCEKIQNYVELTIDDIQKEFKNVHNIFEKIPKY
jgi:hypothetical protein